MMPLGTLDIIAKRLIGIGFSACVADHALESCCVRSAVQPRASGASWTRQHSFCMIRRKLGVTGQLSCQVGLPDNG